MKGQQKTPVEAIREDSASTGAGIEDLSKKIIRYSQAKEQALENKTYIHEIKNQFTGALYQKINKAVYRLDDCANFLDFRHYYTIDELKLHKANFCDQHLLCPFCAIRRGAKQARQGAEKIEQLLKENPGLQVSMLTLTTKNGEDLGERFDHLLSGLRKLSQRVRDTKRRKKASSEFAKILGYSGAIEITKGKGSGLWHPHAHLVILHEEGFLPLLDSNGKIVFRYDRYRKKLVPQLAISDEWFAMMGDSFILDVRALNQRDSLVSNLCEVFKYALKFSSMKPADVFEAWLTLSGRRLVTSGGLLRGVEVVKDLLDEIPEDYDSLPYYEYLYRFLPGAGYSLTETKSVQGVTVDASEDEKNAGIARRMCEAAQQARRKNEKETQLVLGV